MLTALAYLRLFWLLYKEQWCFSVCASLRMCVGPTWVPKPRCSFRYKAQCWLSCIQPLCFGMTFFFFPPSCDIWHIGNDSLGKRCANESRFNHVRLSVTPWDSTIQVIVPFSRGSSQPRDQTQVSRFTGGFFTSWATREAHNVTLSYKYVLLKKLV